MECYICKHQNYKYDCEHYNHQYYTWYCSIAFIKVSNTLIGTSEQQGLLVAEQVVVEQLVIPPQSSPTGIQVRNYVYIYIMRYISSDVSIC